MAKLAKGNISLKLALSSEKIGMMLVQGERFEEGKWLLD